MHRAPIRSRAAAAALLALVLLAGAAPARIPTQTLRPQVDPQGETLGPLERLGGATALRDESADGRVFVETAGARATAFVGELIAIEVRVGVDAGFQGESLIPLFRRHLDVPVQIEAAWLDDADALELARAFVAPNADAATLARNDRVGRARRIDDRTVGGRTFRVYALDVRRIERAPGSLVLAAPRVVYARASAFTDDFVHGRVPADRIDAFVVGRELALDVAPLPEAGRGAHFSGAVGDFRASARLVDGAPDERADRVRVELVVEPASDAPGDLGDARMPDDASFPGFRVLGVLDDRGRARRRVTYDLERLAGTARVAPIAFEHFDPRPPGAYRTATTAAIELPVLAQAGATATDRDASNAPRLTFGLRAVLLLGGLALAAVVVAGIAIALRRMRERTGGGPS